MTTNETSIRIHFFKDSKEEFISLLSGRGIEFIRHVPSAGTVMASGEMVEILKISATIVASLAGVVVAYLKYRPGRKVIITLKDRAVVHAENLSESDLALVLEKAQSITAFDPGKPLKAERKVPKPNESRDPK